MFYLFVLKEKNTTRNLLLKGFWESAINIWAPLKKATSKGIKNSNTKTPYVTDHKWQHLERHCDLFRTVAILNTFDGNKINTKKIIGNYECSSLARSLFDAKSWCWWEVKFGTCSVHFHRWCMDWSVARFKIN